MGGDPDPAVGASEAGDRSVIAAATSVDLRIPKTMRALVKTRPEAGAELREVPVPRPGPGEVLIRLEAVSFCGTDLHIYRWDPWAEGRMGGKLPRIFGHEMAGRVVGHGPGTGAVPLGTRVAAETHLVDWTCYQCRTGREHVCANLRILGVDADGAFAEYMCLPERNAWPSEELAPEIAAIQEPMGNAVHAAFVEPIEGRSVAVDPRFTPLGAPVFLATTWPGSDRPLHRLMMAQDTGGAIKGPVRADFFWGLGDKAGAEAGRMKQPLKMWVLLPVEEAESW